MLLPKKPSLKIKLKMFHTIVNFKVVPRRERGKGKMAETTTKFQSRCRSIPTLSTVWTGSTHFRNFSAICNATKPREQL